MVGLSRADFCGASAAPSKRAPSRQREMVRNILLFIVMDGSGVWAGSLGRRIGASPGDPGRQIGECKIAAEYFACSRNLADSFQELRLPVRGFTANQNTQRSKS